MVNIGSKMMYNEDQRQQEPGISAISYSKRILKLTFHITPSPRYACHNFGIFQL